MVGHSLIFYYFISTYKKLTPNCEICCVSITIYMSAHINNNKKREHKQMTKAAQRARDLVKPTESDRTKV